VDVLARRGHEVDADEIVDRDPVRPRQPADATAEREPGDACPGHDAGRDGQPVRFGRAIEVAERRPRRDTDLACSGIHLDGVQPAEIEHDPAVDRPVAGDVVAPTADGERQPKIACAADRRGDVPHPTCPDYRGRATVDHPVPDAAGLLVPDISRLQDRSIDRIAQLRQGRHDSTSTNPARIAGALGVNGA
jgi:hypothetical protein